VKKEQLKKALGLLCEVCDFALAQCIPMEEMMDAGDLHNMQK
jgi:hypothetical protein